MIEKPSKHVSILLHHETETPGLIAEALQKAGYEARHIQSFKGQSVPKEIGSAAGLVLMGGPQSVYELDNSPYLRSEMRLLENALKQGRPILGICLGSQLLASVLGANVCAGRQKEIGWHRVTLSDFAADDQLFHGQPKSFDSFHWHSDIFDLPRGGTPLASSALTAHQAFRYGRSVYGLLCHLEVTFPHVCTMVETFSSELRSAGLNGSAIKLNAHTHLPALQGIGRDVFARWVALL